MTYAAAHSTDFCCHMPPRCKLPGKLAGYCGCLPLQQHYRQLSGTSLALLWLRLPRFRISCCMLSDLVIKHATHYSIYRRYNVWRMRCYRQLLAYAAAAAVILQRLAALCFPLLCFTSFLYFISQSCVAHMRPIYSTIYMQACYAHPCGIVYQAPIIPRSYFDCRLCCGVRCVTFTLLTYIPLKLRLDDNSTRYNDTHTDLYKFCLCVCLSDSIIVHQFIAFVQAFNKSLSFFSFASAYRSHIFLGRLRRRRPQ